MFLREKENHLKMNKNLTTFRLFNSIARHMKTTEQYLSDKPDRNYLNYSFILFFQYSIHLHTPSTWKLQTPSSTAMAYLLMHYVTTHQCMPYMAV